MTKALLSLTVTIFCFLNPATSQTCLTPSVTNSGIYITSIGMTTSGWGITGGGNYTTGNSGYSSTTLSATIRRNQYTGIFFNVANSTGAAANFDMRLFVDWNGDGDFDDDAEAGTTSASSVAANSSYGTGLSIYPPPNAPTGPVRFRFAVRSASGAATPCGNYPGEIEDYILNVSPNTAPVIDNSFDLYFPLVASSQINNEGISVLQLLASASPSVNTVLDSDPPTTFQLGVAITATSGAGTWQYRIASGAWTAISTVSESAALLLVGDATTRIRYIPSGISSAAITFRGWDRTLGVNGDRTAIAATGGQTAFTTATETASIVTLSSIPSSKMYLISNTLDVIQEVPFNRNNGTVFTPSTSLQTNTSLSFPNDIAFNPGTGRLFWSENNAAGRKLMACDLNGTNVTELIPAGTMTIPFGVAVGGGKAYIIDDGTNQVLRCNLDGTNLETISGGSNISINLGRDIDYYQDTLYYINRPATGDWKIMRANVNGSNPVELFSTPNLSFSLSVARDSVYWTESISGGQIKAGSLRNPGGAGVTVASIPVISPSTRNFRGLQVDATNGFAYVMDYGTDRALWAVPLNRTAPFKSLALADQYQGLAFDPSYNLPLPVRFAGFNAALRGNKVLINWQTSMEVNAMAFEVQHSMDGANFVSIGTVPAAGNSSNVLTYDFTHDNPGEGVHYYRIKQIDQDGHFSFSETRTVLIREMITLSLYPNPATGASANLKMGLSSGRVSYVVTNIAGLQVLSGTISNGENQINISNLKPGVYIIKLASGETLTFTRN